MKAGTTMTDAANSDRRSRQSHTVLLATDSKNSVFAEVLGGKPNPIAYSVYGEQYAPQDIATRLGFNGQLREARFGWYLLGNGYRAYNPVLMRFHSPDSWSPFGEGGLNAYMYCVDPLNFSDPTGHAPMILRKIGKFLSAVDSFLFGGADVTGPSRTKALKATAKVEEVAGPMRPEKENIRKAFYDVGTFVAGAPGARGHPDSLPGEIHGTIRKYPGYEAGAARDGLRVLTGKSITREHPPVSQLTMLRAPPRNRGAGMWKSSGGVHGRTKTFPRMAGGGDPTGMNRNLFKQPSDRQAFLDPVVQARDEALLAAMNIRNAQLNRAGQPSRTFVRALRNT